VVTAPSIRRDGTPDEPGVHYVVSIKVEKVVKTSSRVHSGTIGTKDVVEREVTEVARLVVNDNSLPRLVRKTKAHLDLIDNTGTNDIST
jgi:hypothetical protein